MKDINDKITQVNDEVPKHENGKDYSSLSPTPTQMIKEDCMRDEFNSNCLMMLLDLYGIMITTIALIR